MNTEQEAISKLESKGYKVEAQPDGRVLVSASSKRGAPWYFPNCGSCFFESAVSAARVFKLLEKQA